MWRDGEGRLWWARSLEDGGPGSGSVVPVLAEGVELEPSDPDAPAEPFVAEPVVAEDGGGCMRVIEARIVRWFSTSKGK